MAWWRGLAESREGWSPNGGVRNQPPTEMDGDAERRRLVDGNVAEMSVWPLVEVPCGGGAPQTEIMHTETGRTLLGPCLSALAGRSPLLASASRSKSSPKACCQTAQSWAPSTGGILTCVSTHRGAPFVALVAPASHGYATPIPSQHHTTCCCPDQPWRPQQQKHTDHTASPWQLPWQPGAAMAGTQTADGPLHLGLPEVRP